MRALWSGGRLCVTYLVMGTFWFLTSHWIEQGHARRQGGQLGGQGVVGVWTTVVITEGSRSGQIVGTTNGVC